MEDFQILVENIFMGFAVPALSILGIAGNIITLAVLLYQNRQKPKLIIRLLIWLCLFDSIFLLFSFINQGMKYARRLFGLELPSKVFSTEAGAYFSLVFRPTGYIGNIIMSFHVS
jgi:hypothetical protein